MTKNSKNEILIKCQLTVKLFKLCTYNISTIIIKVKNP